MNYDEIISTFVITVERIAKNIIRNTGINYEIEFPYPFSMHYNYAEIKFIGPDNLDLSNFPHVNPTPKFKCIMSCNVSDENYKTMKDCIRILPDMNYAPSSYWNSILSLFIIHCISSGMQYEKGKDAEIILRSSLINYRIDNPEATTFIVSYINSKTQEEEIITSSMNIAEYLLTDISTYHYFKYSDCMKNYLYRQNDENKPIILPIIY